MVDIEHIKNLLNDKKFDQLANYMKAHGLKLKGNKIIATANTINYVMEYLDKRQLVRKILLNSALTSSALTQ
jgi:hypothetical protein